MRVRSSSPSFSLSQSFPLYFSHFLKLHTKGRANWAIVLHGKVKMQIKVAADNETMLMVFATMSMMMMMRKRMGKRSESEGSIRSRSWGWRRSSWCGWYCSWTLERRWPVPVCGRRAMQTSISLPLSHFRYLCLAVYLWRVESLFNRISRMQTMTKRP